MPFGAEPGKVAVPSLPDVPSWARGRVPSVVALYAVGPCAALVGVVVGSLSRRDNSPPLNPWRVAFTHPPYEDI